MTDPAHKRRVASHTNRAAAQLAGRTHPARQVRRSHGVCDSGRLDVGALGAELRAMRRLLDEPARIGAVDVDRFARWVADRNG